MNKRRHAQILGDPYAGSPPVRRAKARPEDMVPAEIGSEVSLGVTVESWRWRSLFLVASAGWGRPCFVDLIPRLAGNPRLFFTIVRESCADGACAARLDDTWAIPSLAGWPPPPVEVYRTAEGGFGHRPDEQGREHRPRRGSPCPALCPWGPETGLVPGHTYRDLGPVNHDRMVLGW